MSCTACIFNIRNYIVFSVFEKLLSLRPVLLPIMECQFGFDELFMYGIVTHDHVLDITMAPFTFRIQMRDSSEFFTCNALMSNKKYSWRLYAERISRTSLLSLSATTVCLLSVSVSQCKFFFYNKLIVIGGKS